MTELSHETEYALRKDIHYRKGEILRLEYLNAKHRREIERLNVTNDEKDKSIGKCLRRIDEHLQDKARATIDLKLKNGYIKDLELYIKDLESKLSNREEDFDTDEETTVFKDFYLFARQLILKTYLDVNRCDVDLKYMKSAFRYMLPCLGDPRALLSENDKHKIELANSILHKFGVETMDKYEELVMRGDIEIATIDRRGARGN